MNASWVRWMELCHYYHVCNKKRYQRRNQFLVQRLQEHIWQIMSQSIVQLGRIGGNIWNRLHIALDTLANDMGEFGQRIYMVDGGHYLSPICRRMDLAFLNH